MGVVRTTYLIDEKGIIIRANDKVKAADDPENRGRSKIFKAIGFSTLMEQHRHSHRLNLKILATLQ